MIASQHTENAPAFALLPGQFAGQDQVPAKRRVAVVVYTNYFRDSRPRREAEALSKAGMEVDVFCLLPVETLAAPRPTNGVRVHGLRCKRRRGGKLSYVWQYAVFWLAAFAFLTRRGLQNGYDFVHVHNMPDFLAFCAIVPRLLGAKVILDLHDPMPELFRAKYNLGEKGLGVWLVKMQERLSIAFADLVLTPNLAFKRIFVSRGCPSEKIQIVMNTPDHAIFGRRPVQDRKIPCRSSAGFNLMYHGTLVERHGLMLVVDAVKSLRESIPGLELRFYGEPTPYMQTVVDQIQSEGLEQHVQFRGYKPLEHIPRAIKAVDLGIIPNQLNCFTQVNFPTRIFEYLAMGKPVIAPRTPGIRDYFGEDEIIFFEPGNVEDLAMKIQWAYANPEGCKARLEKGLAVYARHTWRVEEKQFVDAVRDLVKPSRAAAAEPFKSKHETMVS